MTNVHLLINSLDGAGAPLLALLALWATVVLGLAWLVVKSLRRASSAVRYCVWQFALTGLLVLPVLMVLLPGIPLGFSLSSASREAGGGDPQGSLERRWLSMPELGTGDGGRTSGFFSEAPDAVDQLPPTREGTKNSPPTVDAFVQQQQPTALHSAESTPDPVSWSMLCVGIWGLGVIAHLAWLARSALRARMLVRGAQSLHHTLVEQRVRSLERQISMPRHLQLLMSADTSVPIVVGAWRPRILLPLECIEWSTDRLSMVVSHELAHVERRDVFWQLVARTVAACYWYHPLIWLAVRRMKCEREHACDDRVLAAGVQPVDYAAGLVEVAAALHGRRKGLAGGVCMAERCQLEDRVRSILDQSAIRLPASARVRRSIFSVAASVVVVLGILRPFSPIPGAAAEASATKDQPSSQLPLLAKVEAAVSPVETLDKVVNVTVETDERSAADPQSIAFTIVLSQPGDVSLKVYDARGKFVRLLTQQHAADKRLAVSWDLKDSDGKVVAPGAYAVRVESGLRLTFDTTFARDGLLEDTAFKSPGALRLDKQGNLYLLDIGASMLSRFNSEGNASSQDGPTDASGTTTLFKFSSDGSAANDWNGKNTIAAPGAPCWGGVAVEPDGSRIYLSQTFTASHCIDVYDGKNGVRLFSIGGFSGEDSDWEREKGGIVDPWWLGLNGDSKLYTVSGERFCAFQRSKEGKAGAVWQLGGKSNPRIGWDSFGDAGDTDSASAIYLASIYYHQRNELFKVVDNGESPAFAYHIKRYADPQTKKEVELGDICGVAYDGEKGLWVIERAEARILKIADNGAGLDFVAAFGVRGNNAAELEFVAPRGAAVSPDGKLLYVIEDGEPISQSDRTRGQARVARYKIDYANRQVLNLTVRP